MKSEHFNLLISLIWMKYSKAAEAKARSLMKYVTEYHLRQAEFRRAKKKKGSRIAKLMIQQRGPDFPKYKEYLISEALFRKYDYGWTGITPEFIQRMIKNGIQPSTHHLDLYFLQELLLGRSRIDAFNDINIAKVLVGATKNDLWHYMFFEHLYGSHDSLYCDKGATMDYINGILHPNCVKMTVEYVTPVVLEMDIPSNAKQIVLEHLSSITTKKDTPLKIQLQLPMYNVFRSTSYRDATVNIRFEIDAWIKYKERCW